MFFKKNKEKQHVIEQLKLELAEAEEVYKRLVEENKILMSANHKITHRLAAMEDAVKKGYSVTLEDIKQLSRDYQKEVEEVCSE